MSVILLIFIFRLNGTESQEIQYSSMRTCMEAKQTISVTLDKLNIQENLGYALVCTNK
jgi:hypothetical protein